MPLTPQEAVSLWDAKKLPTHGLETGEVTRQYAREDFLRPADDPLHLRVEERFPGRYTVLENSTNRLKGV